MSVRFSLCAGAVMVASLCMGLVLGHYATTLPVRDMAGYDLPEAAMVDDSRSPPTAMTLKGPAQIICKGCGPTLAERRFAADMAALDADGMVHGSSDPVVVDYMRDEVADAYPPVALPSPVHRLPANVQRFAGNGSASPVAPDTGRTLPGAPIVESTIAP